VRHEAPLQTPPGKDGVDDVLDEMFSYGTTTLDRLAFQKALDDFYQDKKRPPNDKETREIGASLLKDVVTSPGYFFDSKDKAYSVIADKTPITLRGDNPAAHFAELPRGATFIGPDGQKRVKP